MSSLPESDPLDPESNETRRKDSRTHEEVLSAVNKYFPYDVPEYIHPEEAPAPEEPPLFQSWSEPELLPPEPRIPNFGHLAILVVMALLGLLGASLLTRSALHFHLWGVSTVSKALNDIHYTIGSMAALYLIAFGLALLIFPLIWHKSLFAGLQWNVATALRLRWRLVGAAGICFVLAMIDEVLLPGPSNAPIDKLFENGTAAWLLFAFGALSAPPSTGLSKKPPAIRRSRWNRTAIPAGLCPPWSSVLSAPVFPSRSCMPNRPPGRSGRSCCSSA